MPPALKDNILAFEAHEVMPFQIRKKKGGVGWFCIQDFDGESRSSYMKELTDGAEISEKDGEPNVVFTGFKDLPIMLLKRCVHHYDLEKEMVGDKVGEEVLQTWASRILDDLVPHATRICALGPEAEDSAKKP